MRRSPLAGASVPVRPGPDQLQALLAFNLDQGGVDRGGEARVVQLDREVVALRLLRSLLPGGAELGVAAVEDAEVRAFFGGALGAGDLGLDVEVEGLDDAGEAVLGQPSTVLLRRSC